MLQCSLEFEGVEDEGWSNCLQIAHHIACLRRLLVTPVMVRVAHFLVVEPLRERLDKVRNLQAIVGQTIFWAMFTWFDVTTFPQRSDVDVNLLYKVEGSAVVDLKPGRRSPVQNTAYTLLSVGWVHVLQLDHDAFALARDLRILHVELAAAQDSHLEHVFEVQVAVDSEADPLGKLARQRSHSSPTRHSDRRVIPWSALT